MSILDLFSKGRASDDARIERQKEVQERRDERATQDLRWLLDDERGRRILHTIIYDMAGVTRATPVRDHHLMAEDEGRRRIGLQLLAMVESADFNAAMQMRLDRKADIESMRREVEGLDTDSPKAQHPVLMDEPV